MDGAYSLELLSSAEKRQCIVIAITTIIAVVL